MNLVRWIQPASLEAAIDLCHRIGVFRKLCGVPASRNFKWGPIYQNTETDPTQFAVEPPNEYGELASLVFTRDISAEENPCGIVCTAGQHVFTPEELASIPAEPAPATDIDGWFENYETC